jgi:phage/plasmid-like protein (TIGR03299 family)
MAHELEIRNGEASMFYVNEVPWHGLGTRLSGPATAAEAIKAAKLDWTVAKVPLYAVQGETSVRVPDAYGVIREDLWGQPACPVLGIVGKHYTPLQNAEAFTFFDPIVGQNAAIYHTAGAIRDGERIWLLAKLPSQIVVVGDDVADKYLLLSNSHDGGSAVQVKFTPVRVVCNNTLTLALSSGPTIRVAHTRNM